MQKGSVRFTFYVLVPFTGASCVACLTVGTYANLQDINRAVVGTFAVRHLAKADIWFTIISIIVKFKCVRYE